MIKRQKTKLSRVERRDNKRLTKNKNKKFSRVEPETKTMDKIITKLTC